MSVSVDAPDVIGIPPKSSSKSRVANQRGEPVSCECFGQRSDLIEVP